MCGPLVRFERDKVLRSSYIMCTRSRRECSEFLSNFLCIIVFSKNDSAESLPFRDVVLELLLVLRFFVQ